MTYKTVMVQLDIDGPGEARARYAREIAHRFGSEVIGFAAGAVRPVVGAAEGVIVDGQFMRQQMEDIEACIAELRQTFERGASGNDRASWRGYVGDPTRLLVENARAADLIVTGTPAEEAEGDYNRCVDVGALILSAGRPVLLAARDLSPLKAAKIVIAWKDSREARRAVGDAMPFLVRAGEVLVATVGDGDRDSAKECAVDVVRHLMKHGVKARAEVLAADGNDVGEVLVGAAHDIGADLVVAGGYGHSRMREWAFGGVTRDLIATDSINRLISY